MESDFSDFIKKVLIIGSKGAMGSFFMNLFKDFDLQVYGVDKPLKICENHLDTDIILLCTPLRAFEDVLKTLSLYFKKPILIDICSVKIEPIKIMSSMYEGPIVGTHPLFGPKPEKDDLKIAMVKVKGDDEFKIVFNFFKSVGLRPFECSAEEHDLIMAYIQGLNFITTVTYFASFWDEIPFERLKEFITPSFKKRMIASRKLLLENGSLFIDLFENNPYSTQAVDRFKKFLNLAVEKDLNSMFKRTNQWFFDGA